LNRSELFILLAFLIDEINYARELNKGILDDPRRIIQTSNIWQQKDYLKNYTFRVKYKLVFDRQESIDHLHN
jgi:hypothetical protein